MTSLIKHPLDFFAFLICVYLLQEDLIRHRMCFILKRTWF